jgi:hypothetical protein
VDSRLGVVPVAIVGAVILLAGGVALVAGGGDDGDRSGGGGARASAITGDQFRIIPLGAREEEVRFDFGKPLDERAVEERNLPRRARKGSCIYYGEKNTRALGRLRLYELCFRNGQLTGKRAY